ncbi:MAG: hypothetical protein AMJ54_09260 [Deltaproteobacteria bacterium SG8_13]|nr:MAG: hypothetical protein AMJ54_09260 [Deltaproteobacteria bacterium SG8_13]
MVEDFTNFVYNFKILLRADHQKASKNHGRAGGVAAGGIAPSPGGVFLRKVLVDAGGLIEAP